jgi:hypothetical protein
MSNEFEKLAALLNVPQSNERAPLIDCLEAAELAVRWERLIHRTREQPVEPWTRRPRLKGPEGGAN